MKKTISILLTLVLVFSLCSTAFGIEESNLAEEEALTLNFNYLASNSNVKSPETYYISNNSLTLYISSATWGSAANDIWVAWYNVNTGIDYGVVFSGGSIYNASMNSYGLPAGDYKVMVKNIGATTITSGALQYTVS